MSTHTPTPDSHTARPTATNPDDTNNTYYTPTDPGDTHPLAEHDAPIDVHVTVNGGKDTSEAVVRAGATPGVETSHDPHDDYHVGFADYPFTNDDMDEADHLARVQDLEPRIAVAPDIDEDRDPGTVYSIADELAAVESVDTVVVIPKSVPPSDVPNRFRVGVPLANFGGSSNDTHRVSAYQDCRSLHLLGGSPTKQLSFATRVGIDRVDSLDGASVLKAASFGDIWHPKTSSDWHETGDDASYYERITASLINLQRAFRAETRSEPGDYVTVREAAVVEDTHAAAAREVETVQRDYRVRVRGRKRSHIHPRDADCLKPAERPGNNTDLDAINYSKREAERVSEAVDRHKPRDQQTGLSDW